MSDAPPAPRLLIVADLAYAGSEERLLDVIEELGPLAADPRAAIQLRAKMLDAGQLEQLARRACERVPTAATLILNGPAEVAARFGFDGVHWPEDAIPTRVPAAPRWHAAAVHSLQALDRAERAGVDAVVFGSVFAPGSKPGEGAGLDALREVATAARVPVLAIGGITPDRVASCIDAGARGICVVSGILGAERPAEAAEQYLEALEQAARRQQASQAEVQR